MVDYVYRDGSRLTPWMAYQIERLNKDFKAVWGYEIKVTSGIRLHLEQIDIFLRRYVTAANINGRKVYDTRVWNGTRYYRISSAGTVAVPGTSNHEIQGSIAAVDLRDTGPNAGVAVAGSARSNWLRANAYKYDMIPEGFNFNEAWHYAMRNIFAIPPGKPAGNGGTTTPTKPTQEVEMDSSGYYYNRGPASAKHVVYLIVNNDRGTYHEYSNGPGNGPMPSIYNNAFAGAAHTGSYAPITESHAGVIKSQNKPGEKSYIELDWNDVELVKIMAAAQQTEGTVAARADTIKKLTAELAK